MPFLSPQYSRFPFGPQDDLGDQRVPDRGGYLIAYGGTLSPIGIIALDCPRTVSVEGAVYNVQSYRMIVSSRKPYESSIVSKSEEAVEQSNLLYR